MKPTKFISNIAWLAPNYFKKIGIAVIVLNLIIMFSLKYILLEPSMETKLLMKTYFFNLLNLGLLIIAFSKDKLEDERTMLMRLQAMAFTIIFAVMYLFFRPLVDLVFGGPLSEMTAQNLMLLILLEYIVFYKVQKISQS